MHCIPLFVSSNSIVCIILVQFNWLSTLRTLGMCLVMPVLGVHREVIQPSCTSISAQCLKLSVYSLLTSGHQCTISRSACSVNVRTSI